MWRICTQNNRDFCGCTLYYIFNIHVFVVLEMCLNSTMEGLVQYFSPELRSKSQSQSSPVVFSLFRNLVTMFGDRRVYESYLALCPGKKCLSPSSSLLGHHVIWEMVLTWRHLLLICFLFCFSFFHVLNLPLFSRHGI